MDLSIEYIRTYIYENTIDIMVSFSHCFEKVMADHVIITYFDHQPTYHIICI